jgi:hypothetical protein
MRPLLLSLACVAVCPVIFLAQNKTLPNQIPPHGNGEAIGVAAGIPSICDGIANDAVPNCGFEYGDFTAWSVGGPTDLVGVDPSATNSGSYGALFGTVGDYTYLVTSPQYADLTATSYHVEFWVANEVGGSGTHFDAQWSADGQFDDAIYLFYEDDADPFDWSLQTAGPLPAMGDGQTSPALGFVFRHDPDFWWFDDVDIEVSSGSAGSQPMVRQASSRARRTAHNARLEQHLIPSGHHAPAVLGQANVFPRFGFSSPAEVFRSFARKVHHPITPHPRRPVT